MIAVFKRILSWAGDLRGRVIAGFLIEILIAAATCMPLFVAAWVLGQLIDVARGQQSLDASVAWMALGAIGACMIVRAIAWFVKDTQQESVGYERGAATRLEIGEVLKRVSLGYFQNVKTGDILSTVTTSLNVVELEAVRQADAALGGYIAAALITAWLFAVCPLAGVVSVAAIALATLTLRAINRNAARLTPAARRATDHLSGAVIGLYEGLGTIKSYGATKEGLAPYHAANEELKKARIAIEYGFTAPATVHRIILTVASAVLPAVAAAALVAGQLELWMFAGVVLVSMTIFTPIIKLSDAAHMFADLNDSLDRIQAVEHAEFIDDDGSDMKLDRYDIVFDDVSFSYDGREVIHDVSFDIPEGTTTAIVGPSGSGKTTLSSLMARFYDVNSGAVCIGGHDVREFTVDSLLRNFSMVFQDVYLFDDTIEANIAFGREGATHEMVVEAAKRAQCHDFIMELPQGYDTVVKMGGTSLSGGERQRISIARALLKDAPIVILDEATASIDPENERMVQQALTELTHGKTVVVIAHRLATIEHADQILVVDGGRVVQKGTHAQLVAEEGTYRRFVEVRAQAEGWRIG
ncbi:Lipid A export ATP-binding/permease protein MsbA [Slackia heliotrinireducens]|uniref:ABC-type multidrug transport system, ATPase and permease component n=1 Tax=Slackia heliotrinireducens (strain ATCC 29202 / DSM 20476 / NCTC 11029 / RHS 1) TaxID=471855 RepID=C7N485_SLAHD|nr:ABC transporter ATP-binding protein [Slackia heliotrinireducens]ACV23821.1 ABC-type multidrug transport system, ATPase and permease component [Slackia heliotrinireducens DSM 20476]VEH03511.1 Lipid A export ATP-binding/permease protein MsbA [Slackia heliotrinireducens]